MSFRIRSTTSSGSCCATACCALEAGRDRCRDCRRTPADRRARCTSTPADARVCELCRTLRAEEPVGGRSWCSAHGPRAARAPERLQPRRVDCARPWSPSPSPSRRPAPRGGLRLPRRHRQPPRVHATTSSKDWHLTREESYGRGAGARFRVDSAAQPLPLGRHRRSSRSTRPTGWSSRAARASTTGSGQHRVPTARGRRRHHAGRAHAARPSRRWSPTGCSRSSARAAGCGAQNRRALRRLQAILEEDRDRGAASHDRRR